MKMSHAFGKFRRSLAPLIRPVLEKCPPIRACAVKLLQIKQTGKLTRCNLEFQLPSGDFGVTLEAESTGEYEPVTTTLLESLLHDGMTFVDIGAHVGLFALPASCLVGSTGRVVAFEPHPDNFSLLKENISKNDLSQNMTIIQSAIADVTKQMHLHLSTFNTGDHQLFHKGTRGTVEVPCITLDDYFDFETRVDVIKMDVQGAEAAAFIGMNRVLSDNPNVQIIWELSPKQLFDAGSSAKEVFSWLDERGFQHTVIDEVSKQIQIRSSQDIIDQCPLDSFLNVLSNRNG